MNHLPIFHGSSKTTNPVDGGCQVSATDEKQSLHIHVVQLLGYYGTTCGSDLGQKQADAYLAVQDICMVNLDAGSGSILGEVVSNVSVGYVSLFEKVSAKSSAFRDWKSQETR